MDNNLEVFKERVQGYHRQAMALRGQARTVRDQDFFDGQIKLCQRLLSELIQVQGGENLMEIGENHQVLRVVRISDIKAASRNLEYVQLVKDMIEDLEHRIDEAKRRKELDLPIGFELSTKLFKYGTINNLVSDLRKDRIIDENYSISKKGEALFFVKRSLIPSRVS